MGNDSDGIHDPDNGFESLDLVLDASSLWEQCMPSAILVKQRRRVIYFSRACELISHQHEITV